MNMSNEKANDVFERHDVTLCLVLNNEDKKFLEKCRNLLANRGYDLPFDKFLEICLSTGCLSFIKSNASILGV